MLVQISTIQHRSGRKEDLPILDPAEIGFTIDTGELFIGSDIETTRVLNRNNYPYQNIKILTELDMASHLVGDVYQQGPITNIHLKSDGSTLQIITLPSTEFNSLVMYYNFTEDNNANGQIGKIFCIQNGTNSRLMIERVYLSDPSNPTTPTPPNNNIDNLPGSRLQFTTTILSGKFVLNATLSSQGTDNSVGGDGTISFFIYYW